MTILIAKNHLCNLLCELKMYNETQILEFLLKNILLQYSIANMVTAAYVYTLGLLFMIKLTFAKISN